jgi:16S rRNA (guanine(966)-N(2))-methyltransferase RsmD
LQGARVLDLFAGTGSLGLEALSRGADHVTFVEERRETLRSLEANRTALDVAKESTVLAERVERAVPRLASPKAGAPPLRFDVIFLDPPYALVTDASFLALFATLDGALAAEGVTVLEHASRDTPPSCMGKFSLAETRTYGDTALSFYWNFPDESDSADVSGDGDS